MDIATHLTPALPTRRRLRWWRRAAACACARAGARGGLVGLTAGHAAVAEGAAGALVLGGLLLADLALKHGGRSLLGAAGHAA